MSALEGARSGLLVVDKPRGVSSHDVVAQARRWLGRRDLGHAGTLDPMATGVLLVLVGQACKLSAHLTADSKRYAAEISFGRATDSLDADGRTTLEQPFDPAALSAERVEQALADERARTLQVPPAVSAIKVAGKRAYALARSGAPPELAPRAVQVFELKLLELGATWLRCELLVSKGYYVRALARDLAERLGSVAHLAALRRTESGVFTLAEALAWPPSGPPALSMSLTEAVRAALPIARLKPDAVLRARQGKQLTPDDFDELPRAAGPVAWLAPEGDIVALGSADSSPKVLRGFQPEPPLMAT